MSFLVTSGKTGVYEGHRFISGHYPLARDSEPIGLLEIPTSPSLYVFVNLFGLLFASATSSLWLCVVSRSKMIVF